MDTCESKSERFACMVQVPQIGSTKVPATVTVAIGVDRLVKFFGMAGGLVAEYAFARKEHPVAGVAGGHHAVAHIDSALDELEQIPWRSHSHHVAGVVLRQNVGAEVGDFVHGFSRFAHGKAAHGVSVGAKFGNAFNRLLAQVLVHAALDDSKKLLVVTVNRRVFLEPLHGLGGPLECEFKAMFGFLGGARERSAFVERHDDVGADFALGVHHACGAKKVLRSVENAPKFNAFGGDFAKVLEAPYLESTAVRKNGTIPAHEFVNAACFRDAGRGGAQIQVVGVGENDFCLDVLQLGGSDRLDGRFGAYRHKDGGCHVAVIGVDDAQASLGFFRCF